MVGRRDLGGDDEDDDGADDLGAARMFPRQTLGLGEEAWSRALGGHGPTWHCDEGSLRAAH